jgi:hypothetical protein
LDVSTGRFISRDVFEGLLNDSITLHKYLYANANPVNGIDPSGKFTLGGLLAGISAFSIGFSLGTFIVNPTLDNALILALEIALAPIVIGKAIQGGVKLSGYAQKTYNANFSYGGFWDYSLRFGRNISSVDDLAKALSSGIVKPSEIAVQYINRNGTNYILNSRTAQALTKAKIPQTQWKLDNVTGVKTFEQSLSARLRRAGLKEGEVVNNPTPTNNPLPR